MTRRAPLPAELVTKGFRSADASPRLVPRSRLRASDLNRDVRGTRQATDRLTLIERCKLFQLRMPDGAFFSHETAALLHGIPLPLHRARAAPVHIAMPSPARAPHAAGIVGHKLIVRPGEVVPRADGLRVTTAARTWIDLGSRLELHDLVAAGDFVVHWKHPLASTGQLATALRIRRSRRGLGVLHQAFPLLSDRSESPPESVLRVLVVLAGLCRGSTTS